MCHASFEEREREGGRKREGERERWGGGEREGERERERERGRKRVGERESSRLFRGAREGSPTLTPKHSTEPSTLNPYPSPLNTYCLLLLIKTVQLIN